MKLVSSNPTSEIIQKALADWIASQYLHAQELIAQTKNVPVTRGNEPQVPAPSEDQIKSRIESAKLADPYLGNAIQRGAVLDLDEVIENLK